MLLTEGNPEAINFNVNKKLAQLNKVITLFQSSEEERIFKKQYLHTKYDPKFLEIMNKYSAKMDAIGQKMKLIDEDTNSKYKNIYHSKYELQKKELKESIAQIYNRHNSQIEKHDKIISLALNTLNRIEKDLNNKYNSKIIDEESTKTIEYLKQFRSNSKQKLQKDIDDVHENSSNQLKEYKKSFKNQMKELQNQHQQKIDKIHSLYLGKIQQNDKNIRDVLNQKKDTIQKIKKRYLSKGKTIVLQAMDDFKSMISTEKEKIFTIITEINDNFSKSQKQLSSYKKHIKNEINEIQNLSKKLNQELNDKKNLLKKPEDDLSDMLAQLKASNKKEIDDKTNQSNLYQAKLKESLENTKKQLNLEFEKTKQNLNEIANSKSSEYKKNENFYNDLLKSNNSNENQLKTDFNQNRMSHNSEIDEKKTKFGQEITETRQNHFAKLKEKQNEIIQNKEKTEKQKKIYLGNISELRKQQEEFISLFNKQKQEETVESKREINNLSNFNDEELEKVKNEEELKLKETQKFNEESIEKQKQLLIQKKEQFINDIHNQSQQNLSNYEQNEKNRNQKIIDDFNNLNHEKEKKLNDELNSISAVTNSEDQMKFQKLTNKLELLQEEKSDLIQKNSESKENLISSYKKLTEDENKRHFTFLSSLSKSNNGRNTRQKVLNSLKKQIDQTIENRQTQGEKLKEEIERMKERYDISQSNFISQRAEIINSSKIEEENLLSEIEETKRKMLDLIEIKKKELESQIAEKKKEIDYQNLYYLNEKDEIYNKNSGILIGFNEELKRLKDIYERKSNDYNSKISEESNSILKNRSFLSSDYYERQKSLKIRIKEIKDNIKREKCILDDKAKRDLSQNLDKIAQYEKGIKFNLQKIREDNEGLNGFLDEKIEVLQSKLNEIKRKCNDRKPREEEAKQIEILSLRLSKVTNALNHKSGDLKKCKSFTFDHEKKMNTLYEKPVIRSIPSTPH